MSNNIVQLVDKDSNNIFPVAGSMAGDSVTTQMLKDGAVTTTKIADGAVTYEKVNLATSSLIGQLFAYSSPTLSAMTLPSGGTWYDLGSISIPAHTVAVINYFVSFSVNSTGARFVRVRTSGGVNVGYASLMAVTTGSVTACNAPCCFSNEGDSAVTLTFGAYHTSNTSISVLDAKAQVLIYKAVPPEN